LETPLRVALLAGGLGTRLSEETEVTPKPMVEIGGRPMLWHIMKGYAVHGLDHFVVALGYKGEAIKKFFLDYPNLSAASLTIDTHSGKVLVDRSAHDRWRVDLVETGALTNTGGRVARLAEWLPDDDFCLTYGDGVCDVDIRRVIDFHRSHGRLVTITAVRPPARFGELLLSGEAVRAFVEKPLVGEGWVNGGFMVLNRAVLSHVEGDDSSLEGDVLTALAAEGEVMAFRHDGFWQCMDTLRDVRQMRQLWAEQNAPWKTWV